MGAGRVKRDRTIGGWIWRARARKEHYFYEGRSLCHRWVVTRDEMIGEAHMMPAYPCTVCKRRRDWLVEHGMGDG